ncbi:Golgi membrane exchange factor (Ric1p-Rgp1p) subunit [Diatrype stigma]|uniref:Golgi membrane exchange factor (Ric1p-Rgp1p) subunit n=1 Tax=Diatrype stigma TaxID=117547 RepID=A0AAN9UFS3_9PEZI
MSPEAHSNIRVFVHWDEQTVFSGEEIKCNITFKNIAPSPNQQHPERSRQPSPLLEPLRGGKPNNNGLAPPPTPRRGHRATLSLTVPSPGSRSKSGPQWPPPQQTPRRPGHAHKRSLSIVSIGSAATVEEQKSLPGSPAAAKPQRPSRGHGRSASLQISPRLGSISGGLQSATLPQRRQFAPESSPVFNNHSFPPTKHNNFGRASGTPTTPNTPGIAPQSRRNSAMADFRFPMAPPSRSGSESSESTSNHIGHNSVTLPRSPLGESVQTPDQAPDIDIQRDRPRDSIPTITEHSAPAARILSTTSVAGGTPRSSGEFYSLSNNSSETLASEYVAHPLQNGLRPPHFRRGSAMSINQAKLPEALMMGYAQVQGSFTLDGSLINLGPFEAVKRKAVLGGQGGGVIGLENSRRSSGLFQGFGWGALSNSIGELLGGGELSSIKEMRGAASSKSVPLLSTPQSILFVDLQLGPGESKTYEYTFKLPKGLPPTHRGKAMKISYSLVIGTQRPGGTREQQVRSVSVPFRVLGSVNSHGEILGHDLMSPYIILRDLAKVQALDKTLAHHHHHHHSSHQGVEDPSKQKKNPPQPQSTSSINEFLFYVEELLERPRHGGGGLLSPTAVGPSQSSPRHPSAFGWEEAVASTAKEAIDLAILRSNLAPAGGQSSNRFEIARNGRRVGTVMLARPAYRLGEQVHLCVDFAGASVPCYAVHAALETAERVADPALALRSEASVHRVTRRVHASASEAALFARRVVFSPTIPVSATPEFVTSGLSLEWKVRIEFVVPSSSSAAANNHRAHGDYYHGGGGSGGDDSDEDSEEDEDDDDSNDDNDDDDEEEEEEDEDEKSSSASGVSGGAANGTGSGGSGSGSGGGGGKGNGIGGGGGKKKGGKKGSGHGGGKRGRSVPHPLLEEISRDERGGLVLVAVENLECESFEVAVPLRVYGAVCNGLERLERDEAREEGLAV